jgi:DNA-binding transcriptional MerR regulator
MAHKKKTYSRSQIAQTLGIQDYMVAAWEKQFGIEPVTENGESYYTQKQLSTFASIKELLYEKGLSLTAAKKHLQDGSSLEDITLRAASPVLFEQPKQPREALPQRPDPQLTQKLVSVKEQLRKLSKSL